MYKRTTKQPPNKLKRLVIKRPYSDTILLYRMFTAHKKGRLGTVYSVCVTKIDCGGKRREVCYINDIARNQTDAARIFDMISRGLVMPSNATEIVSDIIGIYL